MIVTLLNGWSTGIMGWGTSRAAALFGLLAALELLSRIACALPHLIRAVGRLFVAFALPLSARALREFGTFVSKRAEDPRERSRRRTGNSGQLALVIWLSVPLLCVWLISLRQPLFTDRYLIWSAPAFYLLVALTLASLAIARDWTRWVVVPLLGAILVINGVNIWKQASTPIKSDFRAAAAYVVGYQEATAADQLPPSEWEPRYRVYLPITSAGPSSFEDLIIFQIPYGRYAFDYYFPIEEYPQAEGLYTNHRTSNEVYFMGEERAARQMRAMTRGYDAAWLVATEVSMWDERNLVQLWLDRHARRVAEAHFNRVDVYRYELPDG
jgi:hypothetical protein